MITTQIVSLLMHIMVITFCTQPNSNWMTILIIICVFITSKFLQSCKYQRQSLFYFIVCMWCDNGTTTLILFAIELGVYHDDQTKYHEKIVYYIIDCRKPLIATEFFNLRFNGYLFTFFSNTLLHYMFLLLACTKFVRIGCG